MRYLYIFLIYGKNLKYQRLKDSKSQKKSIKHKKKALLKKIPKIKNN
jgi:hypothetical protein